jgi:DNA protecting protein DprA
MQTKGLGTKSLQKLLLRVNSDLDELQALVEADPDELTRDFGLSQIVAAEIADARDDATRISEELDRHGITILVWGTRAYPVGLAEKLGETAPPVLFFHGNESVLERTTVAFAGSRKSSEKGLQITRDSAAALAQSRINVLSGYAQGVDMAAHGSAMRAGGVTTAVLAEGILHFKRKAELAELITDENFLVVSEFPPRLRWIARNAMQRNRTICGLANALIVVEAGETGGTLAAGETALDLRLPVFAVKYETPPESAKGNPKLIGRGAIPIGRDPEGKPNLERVFRTLDSSAGVVQTNNEELGPRVRQQELFRLVSQDKADS